MSSNYTMAIDEHNIHELVEKKDVANDSENAVSACLMILNSLLNYANTLDNIEETPFDDHSQKGSTDSDGENKMSAIEYYDYEDFLDHCVRYMGIDESTIILSMMILDRLHEKNKNFHLNEKNVSR